MISDSYVLLIRQVDDSAIAVPQEKLAHQIISTIDEYLRISIKSLGPVTMFNGMDIIQSRYYIKLSCGTYL